MPSWSHKRQLIYLSIPLFFIFVLLTFFYSYYIYEPATCFDGIKNGDEAGTDCGGTCALLCSGDSLDPVTLWTKVFKVTPTVYNIVAYVQNPNIKSEAFYAEYKFIAYDFNNNPIVERKGKVHIPKNKKFAVFEGGIKASSDGIKRVDFEFLKPITWYQTNIDDPKLVITNLPIENTSTSPKIRGNILNNTLNSVGPIELITLVYDGRQNAIGSSRTVIEQIKKDTTESFVFTWPEPFETGEDVCEIPSQVIMVLDRSGSMASISKDPQEPLTTVKNTAQIFVDSLKHGDTVGVVSFANEATNPIDQQLTSNFSLAKNAISNIFIATTSLQNTNIGDGINRAVEELFSERQDSDSKKVIILLTDGDPTHPQSVGQVNYPTLYAESAAESAISKGVSIYTIGLGDKVNKDLLSRLSGGAERYFTSPTTQTLSSIYKKISSAICTRKPNVIEVIPNLIYR